MPDLFVDSSRCTMAYRRIGFQPVAMGAICDAFLTPLEVPCRTLV
jgi:hypothetical protein